jgi:hypothetical protein
MSLGMLLDSLLFQQSSPEFMEQAAKSTLTQHSNQDLNYAGCKDHRATT